MTLETFLDMLPCEIGGYALRITRYYDSDENAEMWEVAYIGDKDKCMCSTTAQSLEVAAYQTTTKLINNGFRSKNSAVCTNCTNYKGCVTCVDGNMAETEYPKKGGEK